MASHVVLSGSANPAGQGESGTDLLVSEGHAFKTQTLCSLVSLMDRGSQPRKRQKLAAVPHAAVPPAGDVLLTASEGHAGGSTGGPESCAAQSAAAPLEVGTVNGVTHAQQTVQADRPDVSYSTPSSGDTLPVPVLPRQFGTPVKHKRNTSWGSNSLFSSPPRFSSPLQVNSPASSTLSPATLRFLTCINSQRSDADTDVDSQGLNLLSDVAAQDAAFC